MSMFRTLTAREIECRVAQIKKTGLQVLLYKDARCDQAILDETVGPMNWQRHHSRENANCIVSIWDTDKKQWIGKEDTGTESNTEAEKGLASDSFKRACVNWGIGRELYTSPFIWVKAADCNIEDEQGRYKCYDRFEVESIDYNEHREISALTIINSKTRNVVYAWNDGSKKASEKPSVKPDSTAKTCERCGKVITGAVLPDGTTQTAAQIIGKSKLEFGGIYCLDCAEALRAAQPKGKPAHGMANDDQKKYIRDNASDAAYEALMTKYGVELERLTAVMADKAIEKIKQSKAG